MLEKIMLRISDGLKHYIVTLEKQIIMHLWRLRNLHGDVREEDYVANSWRLKKMHGDIRKDYVAHFWRL